MDATTPAPAAPAEPNPSPPPVKSAPAAGALTLAEAARELGSDYKTIRALCIDGHVPVYLPPGITLGDGRKGPKGARILRADWDRYVASRRFIGTPKPAGSDGAETAQRRRVAPATGPDGIDRIYGPSLKQRLKQKERERRKGGG